ncbi:hypothetical protein VMCG_01294 [Cytospora schulzeri]|uniref:SMODS and SLOG-associating 2TM effector domain-containing protein n=1 Tax=Cytospora schulzeri TaxID=448051 RepID=A0A423X6U9_9PEZI|nr:hypothetical protein VMCG_01294 [Valsa malicola]
MSSLGSEPPSKLVDTCPLVTPADNAKRAAPVDNPLSKVHTNLSWGTPAGLHLRDPSDECLVIFRRAVGINSDLVASIINGDSLENGRRQATGIYKHILEQRWKKAFIHHTLGITLYICHFVQIIVSAVLTALGPNAKNYETTITVLGSVNTIIAGILALLKGSGLIERLSKDEVEFQKLQDWIEETESLLSVGIIGSSGGDDESNRIAAGKYVEVAFRKYNACFGRSYEIMSTSDIEGVRNFTKSPGK